MAIAGMHYIRWDHGYIAAGMTILQLAAWLQNEQSLCVRPSVCPIMRPQPRRAAGLRLSTVHTPSQRPCCTGHSTALGSSEQCHVHSWLRLQSWSQTCFCRQ